MKKLLIGLFLLLCTNKLLAQTKLYLVPTLHQMHQQNQQYNYDTLRLLVQRLNPDVVAVELRPEDEAADSVYLKQNYPLEMWMMRYWQPLALVKGFDWLGSELEGKPIPTRYWQDHSRIKAMQRLLATDTAYQSKLKVCALYTNQRLPTLKNGSLHSIIQGNDALLVRAYYDCLHSRLRGSTYEVLPMFYRERDRHLQQNLAAIVRSNQGKTIVVLTGVDHYTYLLEAMRKEQGVTVLQP